jgi:hypothetical protein
MGMSLQSKFRQFDEAIKLNRFDENAELREKRDRIVNRLRSRIGEAAKSEGLGRDFKFDVFNQGSYEMGTGVKPTNGRDFDIDVGLFFPNIKPSELDPVQLKSIVFSAVHDHTDKVDFRRPCITVYYQRQGEVAFHVDLAVYAKDPWNGQVLAVGKQGSGSEHREWQPSNPKGLTELIGNRHNGEAGNQFRRVIRYLKRWKDSNFQAEGNAAPRGIALTACAYKWFEPASGALFSDRCDNDHGAMLNMVSRMVDNFSVFDGRLRVALPVPPGKDLFEKMTDQQMKEFRSRLLVLRDTLKFAWGLAVTNEAQACQHIALVLGGDFKY